VKSNKVKRLTFSFRISAGSLNYGVRNIARQDTTPDAAQKTLDQFYATATRLIAEEREFRDAAERGEGK
jgi:hypothetical protein